MLKGSNSDFRLQKNGTSSIGPFLLEPGIDHRSNLEPEISEPVFNSTIFWRLVTYGKQSTRGTDRVADRCERGGRSAGRRAPGNRSWHDVRGGDRRRGRPPSRRSTTTAFTTIILLLLLLLTRPCALISSALFSRARARAPPIRIVIFVVFFSPDGPFRRLIVLSAESSASFPPFIFLSPTRETQQQ